MTGQATASERPDRGAMPHAGIPRTVRIPSGIGCRYPIGLATVTRKHTAHVIRYEGGSGRELVETINRTCGTPLEDPDVLLRAVDAQVVPDGDPPMIWPCQTGISVAVSVCLLNRVGATETFLRDMVGIGIPPLDASSEAALDAVIAWHEIGHAIHPTMPDTAWTRHASEAWCDLLGCAAALASGHDPATVRLYAETRRLGCAARSDYPDFPAGLAHDEIMHRILTPIHYATADACDAMADRWRHAPWALRLSDLLDVCDTVQDETLREPTVVDAAAMDAMNAWFFREERCIQPMNDHVARIDLQRVAAKGVGADVLAREMREHMEAGRELPRPRRDLPGGAVAHKAWEATQGVRNAECPLATSPDRMQSPRR